MSNMHVIVGEWVLNLTNSHTSTCKTSKGSSQAESEIKARLVAVAEGEKRRLFWQCGGEQMCGESVLSMWSDLDRLK